MRPLYAMRGHDDVSDSRISLRVFMAALLAAIHVFLVFQRLIEQSPELNFRIDAAWSHQYGGRIPIR
jgi:hypothetical protein